MKRGLFQVPRQHGERLAVYICRKQSFAQALPPPLSPKPAEWQTPSMDDTIRAQIEGAIAKNEVILFMKGTRAAPACGFSARAVDALDTLIEDYATVDVLTHPEIRDGIKEYSSWPTIPQLYVRGKFVGGTDIVLELLESGELGPLLGADTAPAEPPQVAVTERAARAIQEFIAESDEVLVVDIDGAFAPSLSIGSPPRDSVVLETGGIRLSVERRAWKRAQGITIDYVDTPEGSAFKIDNPNEPARVHPMAPSELALRRQRGEALRLIDVRTPSEWQIARIEGAELLDSNLMEELQELPKNTVLVFQCHHGFRSQRTAEQFIPLGFTQVFNLTGGIDAYSLTVDSAVPRY